MRSKFLLHFCLIVQAFVLIACGGSSSGGGSPPVAPPPPPPPGGTTVAAVDAFPNLPDISTPTKILVEPGVANPRWFALRKTGQLLVFDPDAADATTGYLTIAVNSSGEGGLLGLAFHPDYPGVPEIFLSYTTNGVGGNELRSVISRVILDDIATPSPIGAGSIEQVLLEVDQFRNNHNGGDIAFGADRLLYIGLGDGGGGGDPQETGQDTTRLLGSFVRVDVIGTGAGYTIPAGNPFAANPVCGPDLNADNCPEIYAWGLRNPWRWSFDPVTNVLWAGDVGQGAWEEIDQIELGGNYGWDCREGAHDFETTGCNSAYIDPVAEYDRNDGVSVTGGFVYRGSALPDLVGRYVFGDFGSGRVWTLRPDGVGGFIREELVNTGDGISSFGIDQDGEIYYTNYSNGRIMQLVPSNSGG